ncbi:MAG: CRISPR-associated protein Cas4 [Bacillota bacterium]|jgi:CRISPR-associated exonuclease Cas4
MTGGYDEDSLLPLSGIQHIAFCERQWALIHVEQQWAENVRTVEGRQMHERAHNPWLADYDSDHIVSRSVPLISHRLGLSGQADVVEFWPVGEGVDGGAPLPGREGLWIPKPVEYKRGRPKGDDRDEVQLCAQAMCLEEMLGAKITEGDLYYGQTRRRQRVTLDDVLRNRVEQLCLRMHELFDCGCTPPAAQGRRCSLCSLVDLCLPELTVRPRSVRAYIRKQIGSNSEL